jgi:hypothetical protein
LFESKILRNATNTFAAIIFAIAHLSASQSLSLQRIVTVPVEKLFGVTKFPAKTDQTMSRISEAMASNQANPIVHAMRIVSKRKLTDGNLQGVYLAMSPITFPRNLFCK